MWITLIASEGLEMKLDQLKLLGPFDTKDRAARVAKGEMTEPWHRAFIFEAEEVAKKEEVANKYKN